MDPGENLASVDSAPSFCGAQPNSRALRPQDGAASSSNEDSLEPFSAQAVIDRHYYGEQVANLVSTAILITGLGLSGWALYGNCRPGSRV
jgi:hypothetical protein